MPAPVYDDFRIDCDITIYPPLTPKQAEDVAVALRRKADDIAAGRYSGPNANRRWDGDYRISVVSSVGS